MATLTPTLTLTSNTIFRDQPLNLSVSDSLTVQAPMTDISRMNTDDNKGLGVGIIIGELDTNDYYVYIKHTGILAVDGRGAASITNDYLLLGNPDGEGGSKMIKLFPGEFTFFPLQGNNDTTDDGSEPGGLKLFAGAAAVQVEYAYWKRS